MTVRQKDSLPPVPRSKGPLIPMLPCVDCHKDWQMFESEKLWWENAVEKMRYQFPKRCPLCRKRKRQARNRSITLEEIQAEIARIQEAAVNDEYDGRGSALAQEIVDLGTLIGEYDAKRTQRS